MLSPIYICGGDYNKLDAKSPWEKFPTCAGRRPDEPHSFNRAREFFPILGAGEPNADNNGSLLPNLEERMNRLLLSALLFTPTLVFAAGDLSRQEPVTVDMVLGTPTGEPKFTPDRLTFETGRLYVLRLQNPGEKPFYFGSQGLADSVYTRKVAVRDAKGNAIGEVYGSVRRVEVKPNGLVEWWFVPVRTGIFDDVMSTRAHTEAGMRATIEIR
jgi:uncharacterized cupredoxin-like copper-binding protein